MTHETRIKDAVNMEDLICLLATVRTLKETREETMANSRKTEESGTFAHRGLRGQLRPWLLLNFRVGMIVIKLCWFNK